MIKLPSSMYNYHTMKISRSTSKRSWYSDVSLSRSLNNIVYGHLGHSYSTYKVCIQGVLIEKDRNNSTAAGNKHWYSNSITRSKKYIR